MAALRSFKHDKPHYAMAVAMIVIGESARVRKQGLSDPTLNTGMVHQDIKRTARKSTLDDYCNKAEALRTSTEAQISVRRVKRTDDSLDRNNG